MDTTKEQMMRNELIQTTRTFQAVQNDTGMAEAIDEFNIQQNLETLKNFTASKPITFKTRGGDLVIDKSAKSGLLRTTPEDAPFPTDTNIQFDKFQKIAEQNPQRIASFFAKQNLFESNSDENSVNELEMDNSNAKEEEL
jgi:hypothetical protein